MSMDSYEYQYEAAQDEFFAEVSKQAIEEFQTERLQSFYKDHRDIAVKPIQIWKESASVLEKSPSAALVLAISSVEVGFKAIILRPIISGLVHEESLAPLVTEIFIDGAKQDGALKVVREVLKKYASIDLESVMVLNHEKPFWIGLQEAQKLRNKILHRAETCSKQDAERVIELADYLWNVIFVAILKNLGLHTHDNQTICDQHESTCEAKARIEEMHRRGELSLVDKVRLAQGK